MICPEGCNTCILDDNNQTICTSCYSEYALLNGKCEFCCSGCKNCVIKENNKPSCLSCNYFYALNPNQTCNYCESIDYIGGNYCDSCKYNESSKNFECFNVLVIIIVH